MIQSAVKAQVAQNGHVERNLTSRSTRPAIAWFSRWSLAVEIEGCSRGRVISGVRLLLISVVRMNLKKQIHILALILTLVPALCVQAKTSRLTASDKAQLIKLILNVENFKDSEMWDENANEHTVYLLSDNITPTQIPQIKGIKFVPITDKEIAEMKETGGEYYRFGEFEVRRTFVRVFLTREYMSLRNSNASTMEYRCRKVSGRWRVKGRIAGVGVGESH